MRSQPIAAPSWLPWLLVVAGFWFSSAVLLDFVVMPVMYASGMTHQASFAAAGYTLFWSFNRIELLCAALLVTGLLALRHRPQAAALCQGRSCSRGSFALGLLLLGLVLIDTYELTPQLSALAFSLESLADEKMVAIAMAWMHGLYWTLEGLKLLGLGLLAQRCYLDLRDHDADQSCSTPDVWV